MKTAENKHSFNIPILFIVFNRPQTTKKVFEAIKKIKPSKLYIASDGPRKKSNDEINIKVVRDIVSHITWPCIVKKKFRNKNLGCKYSVSRSIDWFFDNESMGIILEDDVLPNDDFFFFMKRMLIFYKNNPKVLMVTGTNYLSGFESNPYFFSQHFTIWGWATWKRAWDLYDVEMKLWNDPVVKNKILLNFKNYWIRKHFELTFNSLSQDYVDTWDIQWVFTCIYNNGFCLTPNNNLISNIGVNGVHSQQITNSHFMKVKKLNHSRIIKYNPKTIEISNYDYVVHRKHNFPSLKRRMIKIFLKKIGLISLYKLIKIFSQKLLSKYK
jgi:hypothetical protein